MRANAAELDCSSRHSEGHAAHSGSLGRAGCIARLRHSPLCCCCCCYLLLLLLLPTLFTPLPPLLLPVAGVFGGPAPSVCGFSLGPKAGVMQMGSNVQAGAAPARFKVRIALRSARGMQCAVVCVPLLLGVRPLHQACAMACCLRLLCQLSGNDRCPAPPTLHPSAGVLWLGVCAHGGGQRLLELGLPTDGQAGGQGGGLPTKVSPLCLPGGFACGTQAIAAAELPAVTSILLPTVARHAGQGCAKKWQGGRRSGGANGQWGGSSAGVKRQ